MSYVCIKAFASLHAHREICTMTYPLENCRISISVRRHLHHSLNVRTRIMMNKLCICTSAWDIYIMKIASLKGDMCIIWTFRICIFVKKAFASEMKIWDCITFWLHS